MSLVEARCEEFGRFQPMIGDEPDLVTALVHEMVAQHAPVDMVVLDAIGNWLSQEAAQVM